MTEPLPDPRLARLMEQYETERQRRINAERTTKILKTLLAKEKMLRTGDAKSQPEQHAGC